MCVFAYVCACLCLPLKTFSTCEWVYHHCNPLKQPPMFMLSIAWFQWNVGWRRRYACVLCAYIQDMHCDVCGSSAAHHRSLERSQTRDTHPVKTFTSSKSSSESQIFSINMVCSVHTPRARTINYKTSACQFF